MGQFMTSEYIGFYAHIGNVHTSIVCIDCWDY